MRPSPLMKGVSYMNDLLQVIKDFGPILGYISTGIALFVVIKTHILSKTDAHIKEVVDTDGSEKVHTELTTRVDTLSTQFTEFLERDKQFKEKMDKHIESQTNVDRKLMANIIETIYRRNKDIRRLDMNEFRCLTEVYAIYHGDQIHGNSYISELYEDMITWDRC